MQFLLYFAIFVEFTYSHSWVERIYVTHGTTLVGEPGYPRGNVHRTQSFRDSDMMYRLPPASRSTNVVLGSDLLCKESQTTHNQTIGSPMLFANSNDTLTLLYQENGHVTRIAFDPGQLNSGVIDVFGTSHSSPTDAFQNVFDATHNAGELSLLQHASFDDGFCYQDNNTPEANHRKIHHRRPRLEVEGPDIWCGIQVQLPLNLPAGSVYTLYWIWNFDGTGFAESYTTCIDVAIL